MPRSKRNAECYVGAWVAEMSCRLAWFERKKTTEKEQASDENDFECCHSASTKRLLVSNMWIPSCCFQAPCFSIQASFSTLKNSFIFTLRNFRYFLYLKLVCTLSAVTSLSLFCFLSPFGVPPLIWMLSKPKFLSNSHARWECLFVTPHFYSCLYFLFFSSAPKDLHRIPSQVWKSAYNTLFGCCPGSDISIHFRFDTDLYSSTRSGI